MIPTTTVTILLVVVIILLASSLALYIATRLLQKFAKRRAAERYNGKGALLPIANIHATKKTPLMQHPQLSFDNDSFRRSFYDIKLKRSSSGTLMMPVPEIRITLPDEDEPLQTSGKQGNRTSRVMIVHMGESGAAYVTAPPPYEGFQDVDISKFGGLREK